MQLRAATHGYTIAFWWAAAILALAAAVIAACVRAGEQRHSEGAQGGTNNPAYDADDTPGHPHRPLALNVAPIPLERPHLTRGNPS